MNEEGLALKVDDRDNVATVFSNEVIAGSCIYVRDKKGNQEKIEVRSDIPFGHKVALEDISQGTRIMKYGDCIGAASHDIKKGDYVHVHNLEALRGRGDLNGQED